MKKLTCALMFSAVIGLLAAPPGNALAKGPITRLTLDPEARVAPLFEAIDKGEIASRVSARNATYVRLYLTNTTTEPLTVALPKAAGAIHVLKQALGDGFDSGDGGQSQQGSGQSIGGQFGSQSGFPQGPSGSPNNNGNNFNFNGVPGQNFFSIPPEKTVRLEMKTVCLDHGKPNPSPRKTYVLRPIEELTVRNWPLYHLLTGHNARTTDRKALQAAAWRLSNGLSWKELARKKKSNLSRIAATRYFTEGQLRGAVKLVEAAEKKAKDAPKPVTEQPAVATRER